MYEDTAEDRLSLPPKTKVELLERVVEAREDLVGVIDRLTPGQMVSRPAGGWSVKDNLAHIAVWEEILLRYHLGREPFEKVTQLESAEYGVTSFDTLNAAFHERYEDRPLETVLAYFEKTHQRVLAALEDLPEASLFEPPGDSDPKHARPLVTYVVGNTYEHYAEHTAMIIHAAASGLDDTEPGLS